ncbi:MAG: DUF3025 domain-containing protein [Dyella sp.]
MRYLAPPRGSIDPAAFARLPLAEWQEYAELLQGEAWPSLEQLAACLPEDAPQRFVAQTPQLLAEGLHYEQRIAQHGAIATRLGNWHDLFNALIWLRYPRIKRALNAQQVAEIAQVGTKQRSRAQCALTHFDEGGVIVGVRDPALLALWDAHDWHGLFWRERTAWHDGRIELALFGHALLEHALTPDKLLVGKALVFTLGPASSRQTLLDACARGIAAAQSLRDPQELRPLPLSGIPGWHPRDGDEDFYRHGECFQPLRAGRRYPTAWGI